MKLCNFNMYNKAYIELLPLVNLYGFVWKRLQFVISFCLDIFRDNERIYPSESVRFSNKKASFGSENKKFLVLKLKLFMSN